MFTHFRSNLVNDDESSRNKFLPHMDEGNMALILTLIELKVVGVDVEILALMSSISAITCA
jgi:hypothetical protein